MQTFHVYVDSPTGAYLGTITADSLESAQTAVNRALIMPCKVRTCPPPPTDAWRVGSDGRLYRH
jgi:hypothetical protein